MLHLRHLVFLFVLLLLNSAKAAWPALLCSNVLDPINFSLKQGEAYRIASLVRTAKGIFLIDGHYDASGHESLVDYIVRSVGPIERLLWEGEIIVRYPGRISGVRVAMDVSEHFQNYEGEKSDRALATFFAVLTNTGSLSNEFRMQNYSKEREHLDSDLNQLEFNVRHDLSQPIAVIMNETWYFAETGTTANSLRVIHEEARQFDRGVKYFLAKGLLKSEDVPQELINEFLSLKDDAELLKWPKEKFQALHDFSVHFTRALRYYISEHSRDYRVLRVR